MKDPHRIPRDSLTNLIVQVDNLQQGETPHDTVPTGFPSVDKALGGGFRRQDLVVLGGDVGAGKSALAFGMALRAAGSGNRVAYLSGEMNEERLMERALAIEGRASVDEIRAADLGETQRAALGAAALKIRDLPLKIFPLIGQGMEQALEPAWEFDPVLVVIDFLQLLPPPASRNTIDEECAASTRALKALALNRTVACLVVAQLPQLRSVRSDRRPNLDDFGALGSIKQHSDVVLGLYREEMYDPGAGMEGATELIIVKNRNGPTGFVDLYFYQKWMRFEDMLDPDR
jgi:replicative DNA helicase